VNSDYRPGMPEVHILQDRAKAGELGLPISKLAFTLNVFNGGVRNGRFTSLDKRYDVRLRALEQQRESPNQLDDRYFKTAKGALVPLRDVADWNDESTLPTINRYNHMRKVEITANMAEGVAQGEAIEKTRELAEEVRDELGLPSSYRLVQLGNAQAM